MKDYANINVYSDVVDGGFLLPRKEKYTIADVNSVETGSLFDGRTTPSKTQAAFIVKCSAIYHGTDYSDSVENYGKKVI